MQPQLLASVSGLNSDEGATLCVVFAILGVTIVAITKLVSDHLRKGQLNDMEATLKMEMIQRSMSVDEIERVLAAKMDPAKANGSTDAARRNAALSSGK